MAITRPWTTPPTAVFDKTAGTTRTGPNVPANRIIADKDMLAIALVCDNAASTVTVTNVLIYTVADPVASGGISMSTYMVKTTIDTTGVSAGTAAGGVLLVVDLSTLAGQELDAAQACYRLTLSSSVAAKATSMMYYQGADPAVVDVLDNRYSASSSWTLPAHSTPTTDRILWMTTTEAATAPTHSNSGNNSSINTSGGSSTSNVATRWSYDITPNATSKTATTSTRGGSLALILHEYTAPPVGPSADMICGIPI